MIFNMSASRAGISNRASIFTNALGSRSSKVCGTPLTSFGPVRSTIRARSSGRCSMKDHRNALDGRVLRKTLVLAVAPAQTATCPAVAVDFS